MATIGGLSGSGVFEVAAGEGFVWAAGNTAGSPLNRVDPGTGAVRAFDVGAGDPGYFFSRTIRTGLSAVWVRTAPGTFSQIDPASGIVLKRVAFDQLGAAVTGIAFAFDSVWAASPELDQVLRATLTP